MLSNIDKLKIKIRYNQRKESLCYIIIDFYVLYAKQCQYPNFQFIIIVNKTFMPIVRNFSKSPTIKSTHIVILSVVLQTMIYLAIFCRNKSLVDFCH